MTPHKQLFLHDPANGVSGDCFRTAIACLLDVAPETAPHEHADDGPTCMGRIARWLEQVHHCTLIHQWVNAGHDVDMTPQDACVIVKSFLEGSSSNFVLSGTSPRGTFHAVVANGSGLVHDPHPSNDFITGPYCSYYYVTLLGKLV